MQKKIKKVVKGHGTYTVIAPTATKAKSFVREIDTREGRRPGAQGVALTKPVGIKQVGKSRITPRRPKLK